MAPVLVESLTRSFGAHVAVSKVTFQVASGEVLGLLGPNGAGKTTTLRMMAGLITPDAGRVVLGGLDVQQEPLAAKKQLGFLTASTGLYERLTGREVLTTFGTLYGMNPASLGARLEALTRELELAKFLDQRCGTMSSGQKQRVSIARAVIHDPLVYVLDEPTAALDPLASEAILQLVSSARARGKAVIFSTHRMEEAEFLCDRLLFLSKGTVVAEGAPKALVAQSAQSSLTGAFLHFARA